MAPPTKLKLLAFAIITSLIHGFVTEAFPSQTVQHGAVIASEPTPALVDVPTTIPLKRAVTNFCTEWSFGNGLGAPFCGAPGTCIFADVGGNYGFACGTGTDSGQPFTACQEYPQINAATFDPSETSCSATAPYCGRQELVLNTGTTYTNWNCLTSRHSLIGALVSTPIGQTPTIVNGFLSFAVPPSTSIEVITQTAIQSASPLSSSFVRVTTSSPSSSTLSPSSSTSSPSSSTSSPSSSSSSSTGCLATATNPSQCNSSSTPIGAIVGGVIGGLALLALVAFLVWFLMYRRRQDRLQNAPSAIATDTAKAAAMRNRQSDVFEVEAKPDFATYQSHQRGSASSQTAPIKGYVQDSRSHADHSVPSPGSPAPAYSPDHPSSTGNNPMNGSRLSGPWEDSAELDGTDGRFVHPHEIGDAAYRPYRPL